MLIGYARVSTPEQDLSVQLEALTAAGCDKVFTDQASGSKANREGLAKALTYAQEGDTLVVWKLDRLGHSMKGLVNLAADLKARHIDLCSLTDDIDTRTMTISGRFFFQVMTALAAMERALLLERTRIGLEAAKRAGKLGGRKRVMTPAKLETAKKLLDAGTPPKAVASSLGVSIATLYRHLPAGERQP